MADDTSHFDAQRNLEFLKAEANGARVNHNNAITALRKKLAGTPLFNAELDRLKETLKKDHTSERFESGFQSIVDHLKNGNHSEATKVAVEHGTTPQVFTALFEAHAPGEFSNVKAACVAHVELKSKVKEAKAAISAGANAATTTPTTTPSPERADTPTTAPAAEKSAEKKVEGFWAKKVSKAKRNLGGEAWKESKVKTGFRTAGVALGASMVVDAALRGKARDDEGKEVDRSGAARVLEAAAGIGVGAGSALIGGRA